MGHQALYVVQIAVAHAACDVATLSHEAHFFAIHRLIHTPLLYKWIHSIHHNSIKETNLLTPSID